MSDKVDNYLITGMYLGGAVAIAPVALGVMVTSASTVLNTITGLFLSIITNGQWGSELTAFWISPHFWAFSHYAFVAGTTFALTCGILYAINQVSKKQIGVSLIR